MNTYKQKLIQAISIFSPSRALRMLKSQRYFEAASHGRIAKSFAHAMPVGPNADLYSSYSTILSRSRYMYKNNMLVSGAVQVLADNVVGEGIRPAPTGTANQNKRILDLWKSWAGETICDFTGKTTFYGLQDLICRELIVAGECLIIRRRTNDRIPIKLQILQSEQLDMSRNYVNDLGYAKMGVQFDNNNHIIGYWVFPVHPYDYSFNIGMQASELIKSEDCLHICKITEAGQIRGIPTGVQSFIKANSLDDYDTATLEKQKVAASFAAFVTGGEKPDDERPATIEPGQINYLGVEEKIEFSNPPSVTDYDSFSSAMKRNVASSYGITYESLTKDYSKVNFTSGRMGKMDVTTGYRKIQYNILVPQLCAPIWDWFMQATMMAGLMNKYIACGAQDWTAPRIQQIDPVKETNAQVTKLANGLTSYSEIQRENGNDPQEVATDYANDRKMFNELKVELPWTINNNNNNNTDGGKKN